MELCQHLIAIFLICFPLQCLTASLDIVNRNDVSSGHFGPKQSGFSSVHNPGNIQSWSDWLKKRSFGEFPFGEQNLQAWKEWMVKRGLQTGNRQAFGQGYAQPFQQWTDWMDKRDDSGIPLSQAQKDWLAKRGLGGLSGGYSGASFGQPSGNFQSWVDYSKRSGLDPNAWIDQNNDKRNFGLNRPGNPFNTPFGSNPQMMKWQAMIKRESDVDKRQLGGSPSGFGHNNQYFTNGLQDWRNTFQGSKRTTSDDKNSKNENN